MRIAWLPAALLLAAAVHAEDKPPAKPAAPTTLSEKLTALEDAFDKKERDVLKEYQEAKTPEDHKKVIQRFRDLLQSSAREIIAFAEQNAKDPIAVKAWTWVVSNQGPGGQSDEVKKAYQVIARDYAANADIGPICQALAHSESTDAEALLRTVRDKNPSKDVRGFATYSLARVLLTRADDHTATPKAQSETLRHEGEQFLEEVIAKYADVKKGRGNLGKSAEGDLFEFRNLIIGKVAPDIQGTDSDGKMFKLTDYRGKVVVLDFWALW